jgi:dTMP kinase
MHKPSARRAPFIVLEGIDGAGTTTQTARLTAALRARNIPSLETRQPSDGPLGMLLRQMLKGRIVAAGGGAPDWRQLGLLFAADRLDHVQAELLPNLEGGRWVVCDRYDYSSIAYQSATAVQSGSPAADAVAWLRELNRHAPRPDLTIVLDVSPQVARVRRAARAGSPEIFDDDPFQAQLSAFYAQIDAHFAGDRIEHVDGDGDADSVFAALWRLVTSLGVAT